MGNDEAVIEAPEEAAETPDTPLKLLREPASEPVLSDDEIQPHPDLLNRGRTFSVPEESGEETPNSGKTKTPCVAV